MAFSELFSPSTKPITADEMRKEADRIARQADALDDENDKAVLANLSKQIEDSKKALERQKAREAEAAKENLRQQQAKDDARAAVLATRIQANNKRLGEIGKRACELDRALTQLLSDVDALLGDNQAVVSEMRTLSVSKEPTHETPILPHNRPVFLGQVREKVRAHRLIIGDKYPSILLSL